MYIRHSDSIFFSGVDITFNTRVIFTLSQKGKFFNSTHFSHTRKTKDERTNENVNKDINKYKCVCVSVSDDNRKNFLKIHEIEYTEY